MDDWIAPVRQIRPASDKAPDRNPRRSRSELVVVEALAGVLVLHQFDTVEEAITSNITDDR